MFDPYIKLAHSLVQLMQPLVEIVIHDLTTNKIVYIEGGLSLRQVGDPCLLESTEIKGHDLENVIYHKLTHSGRLVKSTTIPILHAGKTAGLMCINYDVSLFQEMQNLAALTLTSQIAPQPAALFKNDWQERIHLALHKILTEKGKTLEKLSFDEKKEILYSLYQLGAFQGRHASDYIAKILKMGRATIFKYLKQWKAKNDNPSF